MMRLNPVLKAKAMELIPVVFFCLAVNLQRVWWQFQGTVLQGSSVWTGCPHQRHEGGENQAYVLLLVILLDSCLITQYQYINYYGSYSESVDLVYRIKNVDHGYRIWISCLITQYQYIHYCGSYS